jgi:hypothetical protein
MAGSDRNTWPCRGCGKPFLQRGERDRHEATCPQVIEEAEADADSETADMDDQDQRLQQAPDPEPEAATLPEPSTAPDSRPVKAVDFGSGTCGCCGSDVGSTTRQGLCYGCDLAGCSTDTSGCEHHRGVP